MFDFTRRITGSKSNILSFCGSVIMHNNKYVFVQEASRRLHGRWSIPGGKIEAGENICEAAQREVKEETNLDVTFRGLVGVYHWYSQAEKTGMVYYVFLSDHVSGEMHSSPEDNILMVKLFNFQEVMSMPIESFSYPQFRQVIKDHRRGKLYPLEIITCL